MGDREGAKAMDDSRQVTVFQPYPFQEGQKIRIEGGPRQGDWKVVGLTDRKVTLRCPISGKEFEWDRFCYQVDERTDLPWPQQDA
jgi:hypothetical protein